MLITMEGEKHYLTRESELVGKKLSWHVARSTHAKFTIWGRLQTKPRNLFVLTNTGIIFT